MAAKRAPTTKENAVRQDRKPSYGKPPKEHQFKPGQSGNPDGPPKRRTNLWVWFCKYMAMTDAQIARLDKNQLTQSQQTALGLVKRVKAGEKTGSTRMARYIVDREEGKAVEHLVIDRDVDLTDAECEQLRELIRRNHGSDADE